MRGVCINARWEPESLGVGSGRRDSCARFTNGVLGSRLGASTWFVADWGDREASIGWSDED